MTIETQLLRTFLSEAANIKPNVLFQNLDSIKIECTGKHMVFTKTNNNIFLTYTAECLQAQPEVLLVNERTINGIAQTTQNAVITITQQSDHILIVDGSYNTKNPIQDIAIYPVTPISDGGQSINISQHTLECIKIASKYINTGILKNAYSYVYIGSNGIFASNSNIVYYNEVPNLPEVFFSDESLLILKPVDGATYDRCGNYDFFSYSGYTYGFIKTECLPIDFLPVITKTGTVSFAIARQDLIYFCTRVKFVSKQSDPICTFFNGVDILELEHVDSDFNGHVKYSINSVATNVIEPFKFSLESVNILLNSLPYENLIFTQIGNHYKVTTPEDQNYIGVIAGLN